MKYEEVDMKGVYGVDTNIINMDLERLSGALLEPRATTGAQIRS